MKKALGINASPRKSWNTAQMVQKALEGASSVGLGTRLVNLYDLNFKGCASCFACKRLEHNAKICVIKDDLRPVLEEAMGSDVLILGTPIYFGDVTAGLRAFLERFLFMNYTYYVDKPSKFDGRIASGIIATMNVTEQMMLDWGYPDVIGRILLTMDRVFKGPSEWLAANDTLQFDDYSKYMADMFDPAHKAEMHAKKFPQDLQAAYDLGVRLATAE